MKETKEKKEKIKKILTVLIPVYNTEIYIEKCLNSIADYSLNDILEVIIVSDGSKDNSIKIAKKIQKKYPKIFKIIEKENGGHGSTINVGIEQATGKYFRVLDSDDWFDSNEFKDYINKLKKCNSDMVITNYSHEYVNDNISILQEYTKLQDSKEYNFNDFDINLLNSSYFVMASITYKTDILKEINLKLPEKTFYVDMIYDTYPIKNVNTFIYFNNNVYKYYIGRIGQSVNKKSYAKNYNNHNLVTHQLIEFYVNNFNNIVENKRDYLKKIIIPVINTNYAISAVFIKKHKIGYIDCKKFDRYLFDKSKDLYKTESIFINFLRKTNFIFVFITFNFMKEMMYNLIMKKRK